MQGKKNLFSIFYLDFVWQKLILLKTKTVNWPRLFAGK